MYMMMWTLWMVVLFGEEPIHIPLEEFITQEDCLEMRDLLITEMMKTYPDEAMVSRFYCEPKITSKT